ncbi:MAG: hypothetical protein ACO20H_03460 [Bacteriovoracaceae bacterium]
MKKPLQFLSWVNWFIPSAFILYWLTPFSSYHLELTHIGESFPLFTFILSGLFLKIPKNYSVYFFILNHIVVTVNLLVRSPRFLDDNQLLIFSIFLFNTLTIFSYLWPLAWSYLITQFPALDRFSRLKPIPSICTFRRSDDDKIYEATLLRINNKNTIITPQLDLDLNQNIFLQVSFNGYILECPAEVLNKFDYQNELAVTLNIKLQTIMDYIVFLKIKRLTSRISINDFSNNKEHRIKLAS